MLFKRHFYMIANNCKLLCYRFGYKFVKFVWNTNKNQFLSKLVVWKPKIFLLFVDRELHSTSKECQIQWTFIKEFSHMFSLFSYKCLTTGRGPTSIWRRGYEWTLNQIMLIIYLQATLVLIIYLRHDQRRIQNPVEHLRSSFLQK